MTCKLAPAAGRTVMRARLSRRGHVRATGVARGRNGSLQLRLRPARLAPGRYRLTLRWRQDGVARTATGTLQVRAS